MDLKKHYKEEKLEQSWEKLFAKLKLSRKVLRMRDIQIADFFKDDDTIPKREVSFKL